jgi:cytochrome b
MRESTIEAGGVTPPATVNVWDPFVRIFHWSVAALFLVAYVTGDAYELTHNVAGYMLAGLLVLRIVWGFVGPAPARFSNFVYSPRAVMAYLRDAIRFRSPRYLGHNPAGGVMILALLTMLIALSITGHMMTTDAYWGSQWVDDLHDALAKLTVGLIVIHVVGVLVASVEHRENLVKSMITGRKRSS